MKARRSQHLVTILLAAGLAALAMLAVAIPYVAADADCTSCHQPEAEGVAAGVHASASCVSCHSASDPVGRLRFGGAVLVNMRIGLGDLSSGDAVSIPNERCESCHVLAEGVSPGAVRINHAACATNERCVRCHDVVVHGPDQQLISSIDMFDCLRCHTRENQSLACNVCHEGRLPRDRVRSGTFAVTHGAGWEQNHGLGSVSACSACHLPEVCVKCHGDGVPHGPDFKTNHGDYAQSPAADCTSCHLQTYCDGCHPLPMPHPPRFKNDHAEFTRENGEEVCLTCHGGDDCERCHVMHVHPGGAIGGGSR